MEPRLSSSNVYTDMLRPDVIARKGLNTKLRVFIDDISGPGRAITPGCVCVPTITFELI